MKYFDLHCDTLYEAYKRLEELDHNDLNVSFEKAKVYDDYRQIFAVWTEHGLTSYDAYEQFLRITDLFADEIGQNDILSVEGGSLLEGDFSGKLEYMKDLGVRLLTLVWKDECFIGGAWNTDSGLTDAGKAVVEKMFDSGITPDLAHASDRMIYDVCDIAIRRGLPVVNTHTCSRSICDHKRNITDDMFNMIVSTGGIVGITLYPFHVNNTESCTVSDVIKHIDHFIDIGGSRNLCIGADLDGVEDMLPDGIRNVSDVRLIADMMIDLGYPHTAVEDIFFNNAYNFFKNK